MAIRVNERGRALAAQYLLPSEQGDDDNDKKSKSQTSVGMGVSDCHCLAHRTCIVTFSVNTTVKLYSQIYTLSISSKKGDEDECSRDREISQITISFYRQL